MYACPWGLGFKVCSARSVCLRALADTIIAASEVSTTLSHPEDKAAPRRAYRHPQRDARSFDHVGTPDPRATWPAHGPAEPERSSTFKPSNCCRQSHLPPQLKNLHKTCARLQPRTSSRVSAFAAPIPLHRTVRTGLRITAHVKHLSLNVQGHQESYFSEC